MRIFLERLCVNTNLFSDFKSVKIKSFKQTRQYKSKKRVVKVCSDCLKGIQFIKNLGF